MKQFKDLVKSKGFILANIQNDLYGELSSFMEKHDLKQVEMAKKLKVSESYISQVLNGNFNYTISKLIDLSLAINKIPTITFTNIDAHEASKDFTPLNSVIKETLGGTEPLEFKPVTSHLRIVA